MRHILLGYDLRKCGRDYLQTFWLSQRRHQYLLRSDVEWPLSVDPLVWPSMFDLTTQAEYRSSALIEVTPQTTVQLGVKLWDDRTAMESTFTEHVSGPMCVVRMAVELCLDKDLAQSQEWNFLAGSLPAAQPEMRGWTAVGYDVADRYMLSGLMNCGYSDEDRAALSKWCTELNDYGLFDDVGRAEEYRLITDKRIPDHAPFYVCRILVQWNAAGGGTSK